MQQEATHADHGIVNPAKTAATRSRLGAKAEAEAESVTLPDDVTLGIMS